jgi:hypothetical protein
VVQRDLFERSVRSTRDIWQMRSERGISGEESPSAQPRAKPNTRILESVYPKLRHTSLLQYSCCIKFGARSWASCLWLLVSRFENTPLFVEMTTTSNLIIADNSTQTTYLTLVKELTRPSKMPCSISSYEAVPATIPCSDPREMSMSGSDLSELG